MESSDAFHSKLLVELGKKVLGRIRYVAFNADYPWVPLFVFLAGFALAEAGISPHHADDVIQVRDPRHLEEFLRGRNHNEVEASLRGLLFFLLPFEQALDRVVDFCYITGVYTCSPL